MSIFLILFLGFVTRSIFLLSSSSDEYSHLWMIKKIKKANKIWKEKVEDSLIPGFRGYPPLAHLIVSIFPEKYWLVVGRLFNIFYDLIGILILYFFTEYIFIKLGVCKECSWYLPALLYATSPISHPVTARLKAIGGRTLGNLLVLIYFINLSFGILFGNRIFYILCIPLGWLIVFSSQFATQYWIFTSIILSLLNLDYTPLLLCASSIISGIFIPGLGLKKILQRKIDHYRWYIRNYGKKGTTTFERNKFTDTLLLPAYLFKKPKYFLSLFFHRHSWLIVVYNFFPLILYSWHSDFLYFIHQDKILFFIGGLFLSSFVAFLITSIRPFLFLGQAERYFEYGIGFFYIYFIYYLTRIQADVFRISLNVIVYQIAVLLTNFIYIQFPNLKKKLSGEPDKDFKELLNFLATIPDKNILSIPTKLSFKLSFFLNEGLFYYDNMSNLKSIDGIKYMEDEHIVLSYPITNLDYLFNKYGINTLVISKFHLKEAKKMGVEYKLDEKNKAFENEKYIVYIYQR